MTSTSSACSTTSSKKHPPLVISIAIVLLISFVLPTALAYILPSNPTQYYNAYLLKHRIWENTQTPRLMLTGFSEMAFGIDSRMVEEATPYNVCNFGLHSGLGSEIVLGDMLSLLNPGDVVVYSVPVEEIIQGPEANAQSLPFLIDLCGEKVWSLSLGNRKQLLAGSKHLLRGKLHYNFGKYIGLETFDPNYNSLNFNSHGDESAHWDKESICTPAPTVATTSSIPVSSFNERHYRLIVQTVRQLQARGTTVLLTHPPMSATLYAQFHVISVHLETRLQQDGMSFIIPPDSLILSEDELFDGTHANRKAVSRITSLIIQALKTTCPQNRQSINTCAH